MPPIVIIGAGAIVVGLAAVCLIVWKDLGPRVRLGPAQRVALAAALGSGVIAFGLKLAVIEGLVWENGSLIPRQITPKGGAGVLDRSADPVTGRGLVVWTALPSIAPEPADNPTTPAKVALGARLFADPLLSSDGTVACASCHDTVRGAGADGRRVALGVGRQAGKRNAPTVYNAAFQARLFWDGRAASLEDQARGPLANPIEMGNADLEAVVRRVAAVAAYRSDFAVVFGPAVPIDVTRVVQAISAYERTLITADTAYDRFVGGQADALSPQQLRGMYLFETVGCVTCHAGPNFSMASTLAPQGGQGGLRLFPANPSPDAAKYRLTDDKGAVSTGEAGIWRVPSLRNVALTGPYFHNGSVDSLAEAVRIMATAQTGRVVTDHPPAQPVVAWLASTRTLVRYTPPTLSNQDIDDIVAFLQALTSDRLAAAARGARPVRGAGGGAASTRPLENQAPLPSR